jgi:methylase of polypeptide subunit release factors
MQKVNATFVTFSLLSAVSKGVSHLRINDRITHSLAATMTVKNELVFEISEEQKQDIKHLFKRLSGIFTTFRQKTSIIQIYISS